MVFWPFSKKITAEKPIPPCGDTRHDLLVKELGRCLMCEYREERKLRFQAQESQRKALEEQAQKDRADLIEQISDRVIAKLEERGKC
jgi:predicted RNA-binding protein (virulence factor B family)